MADIHFPDGTRITGASQEAADMYAMLMGTGANWNSATEGNEALERAGISVGGNVESTPVEPTPTPVEPTPKRKIPPRILIPIVDNEEKTHREWNEEQRMRAGEEVTRTHDEKPSPFPEKKKKIPRRILVPVVDKDEIERKRAAFIPPSSSLGNPTGAKNYVKRPPPGNPTGSRFHGINRKKW